MKYFLIILAVIIVGFSAWCFYIASETKTSDDYTEVDVYFGNADLYNRLQQKLCPNDRCPQEMYDVYGVSEYCSSFFPVKRTIRKTDDNGELVRFLIAELKDGPTQEEISQGFIKSNNSFIAMLREEYWIKEGVLTLQLDKDKFREWEEIMSPRSLSSLASCEWNSIFDPIYRTFKQIKGVERVEIDFCGVDSSFCVRD